MEQGEPIYQERFVKNHVLKDQQSILYALQQIGEVHPNDMGWTMSEPIITPNPDGSTVTIEVELKKYDIKTNGIVR